MIHAHLYRKRDPAEVWLMCDVITKVLTRLYRDRLGHDVRIHLNRHQFMRQRIYEDGYHPYHEAITLVAKSRLSAADYKIIDDTLFDNLENLLKTADPDNCKRLREVTVNISEPGQTGIHWSSLKHHCRDDWNLLPDCF